MTLVQKEIKKVTIRPNGSEIQIRPKIPPYLCFTANTAGSTVRLNKAGSPTDVTLETSTDWSNWSTYTIWDIITLSNIWDKVYFRNTSETTTGFSKGTGAYYIFYMSGSIAANWDITSLINKNCTDTLSWNYCFWHLFNSNTSLTTAPSLPATTLTNYCYQGMFGACTNLETLPKLPAVTLTNYCYNQMFNACSKIKLSATQTWEYQTEYRIPTTWTWTIASAWGSTMFANTWWTFKSNPSINTTYYTSNTVV